MRQDLTDITFLLDRTGSMASIVDDTIGGFNHFVESQKKEEGDCHFTLVQFDSQNPQEVVCEALPIGQVAPLTTATFVPRASTPLLDALGQLIVRTGERLGASPEPERPGKVFFVILTDGLENASCEYTRERVFDMIQHQREKYGWQFVFLGADQDAVAEAASYGMQAGKSLTFAKSAGGTAAAYHSTSDLLLKMRSASPAALDAMEFSDADRAQQAEELGGAPPTPNPKKRR